MECVNSGMVRMGEGGNEDEVIWGEPERAPNTRVIGSRFIRGEPERAPNTREAGSGFICILGIYILVCLWGDHFSEERVKF